MIIDNSSPWNDSDNDGVIDELDECPDTMEKSNLPIKLDALLIKLKEGAKTLWIWSN